MSIQELAKKASEALWTVRDGTPTWVSDLCYRAHDDGDLPPDDWRHRFVLESLDALSEAQDPDDVVLHADIYAYELLKWVSSHASRKEWVDQAVELQGWHGLTAALQDGQAMEKNHVLGLVRGFLREIIDG